MKGESGILLGIAFALGFFMNILTLGAIGNYTGSGSTSGGFLYILVPAMILSDLFIVAVIYDFIRGKSK